MNGLDIVRRVYQNLRRPSESALPYRTILDKASGVIKKKKLDLALSEQNTLGERSEWFTPSENDFAISDYVGNVLLPIKVESRSIDSDYETGDEVPIVNYQVLGDSYGAVSFYGSPLRMSFRDTGEFVRERQYRISYESDFSDNVNLANDVKLPDYFQEMIVDEATYATLPLVEDNSPEFASFINLQMPVLLTSIADWSERWDKYVKSFKGRSRVQKRTFLDRQSYPRYRIRRF